MNSKDYTIGSHCDFRKEPRECLKATIPVQVNLIRLTFNTAQRHCFAPIFISTAVLLRLEL